MSEPIVRGVVVDRPSALRGGDPERPVRITVADAAYADLTPHEARSVAAALEMEAATAGPTEDASAPTPPGEGHRTGTGGPDAPGASEGLARWEPDPDGQMATVTLDNRAATFTPTGPVHYPAHGLDAAIEAARSALQTFTARMSIKDGVATISFGPDDLAAAAVRAAEPILRQAVAEDLAANPVRWEYGIFQDRTADGLGHAFLATRHTREDALAAVDRLANEEPNYPAYAAKRSVRYGTWEPLDVAREVGRGE